MFGYRPGGQSERSRSVRAKGPLSAALNLTRLGDIDMPQKRTSVSTTGTGVVPSAYRAMCDSAQKLRAMAKQTRVLSRTATDTQGAQALQSLAELYERQAVEIERREAHRRNLETILAV